MIFTKTCTGIKKNKIIAIYRPPALSRCSDFVFFFGFFDACAGFVHLVVCFFCFFWCLCRFCDSNLHQTCTGIKKTKKTKAWSSQNLHRHQKNQNNQNFAIYRPPALSRCSDFVFFGFFDACAGFVHLVVCFFWFFWCLCRFCDSYLHQTCTGIKKTKKNKAWSSQNLRRHQKKQNNQNFAIYRQPWVDAQTLVVLVFLMPVQVLCI